MKIYVWNKEVFEKVKSGEWTFEQFEAWSQERDESRYDRGYTDGWDDARADSVNDRSGE